jgi:hypothetical protein
MWASPDVREFGLIIRYRARIRHRLAGRDIAPNVLFLGARGIDRTTAVYSIIGPLMSLHERQGSES